MRAHVLQNQNRAGRPRLTGLLLSVAGLSVLAGCGGEDGTIDVLSYLSQYGAPAPVTANVLALTAALPANIMTLTTNLLNTAPYQNTRTTNWTAYFTTGPALNGLNSDPLRTSGAAFAHAAGYTGQGQTIAVSDGAFIAGFDEIAAQRVTVVNNGAGALATDPHGTVVSSVALGNSADSVGVAPGANLLFGSYQSDVDLAAVGVAAANAGAVAWNNSWGYTTLYTNENGYNGAFVGPSGNAYFAALSNYAANGVVVFAVSNDETERHSHIMEGLPAIRPALEAGWIAAVNGVPNVANGNVTGVNLISSACYEAARWCLIADGTWQVPDYALRLDPQSTDTKAVGSSFAAPQISGALAVLAQAFPTLSPHELRVRLLASADDGFFAPDATVQLAAGYHKGYSVTYGHGFLDIEAALNPIGPTAMALADGTAIAVSAPVLITGTAMGDAVTQALTGTSVAVQDALATSFAMPASALVAAPAPSRHAAVLMAEAVRSQGRNRTAPDPLADPFAGYRGQTLAMTAPDTGVQAAILLPQAGEKSTGMMISQTMVDGPTRIDLGLTLARDGGGTLALGGAGGQAALAASVSLGVLQNLGDAGFFALSGEVGIADLGNSGSVARGGSALFNRIAVEAGQSDVLAAGDRISFGIGMPLAITSGNATVTVPVIRAAGIGPEALQVDLAPDSRQVDLTLRYQTPLTQSIDMSVLVAHSENFGNRAGVRDTGAAVLFSMRF